jgi:alpha-tubulin suppressor-like RCC1 family protein
MRIAIAMFVASVFACTPSPSLEPPPGFPPPDVPPPPSKPEPLDPPEPPQRPGPRPEVTAIALGAGHACARIADGTVRCWGANHSGQLGDGTRRHREIPVVVRGLVDVESVVPGGYHTCALVASHQPGPLAGRSLRVKCWGWNPGGQLGDGTLEDRATPVDVVGLDDVKQLALGEEHTCALTNKGIVSCWGENTCGQLGNGERYLSTGLSRPHVVPGLANVVEIAASGRHTCARLRDETVLCWGGNDAGELGSPARDKDPYQRTKMNPPASFPGALRPLGTPWSPCPASSVPARVTDLAGVKQLALGDRHSCALLADATVRCWGIFDNRSGSPRTEPPRDQYAPRQALATDVTRIASGGDRACALRRDGSVVCSSEAATANVAIGAARDIGVANELACALVSSDVTCWGKITKADGKTAALPGPTVLVW